MFTRIVVLCLTLVFAAGASAQSKKRIEKAADLPRFSYKIDGKLEDMLRDDAKFKPFAAAVRRDTRERARAIRHRRQGDDARSS